eukprot:TRINITY_DN796_c0_g1_i2.p1 TRINITY_DN796_c0_g1~~TRINITY_DN796_c0_g1_i2.p1  ORF type:complete len:122 (+),score=3.80 TRINITY_DN796_c0_g1_i2:145-510(+)
MCIRDRPAPNPNSTARSFGISLGGGRPGPKGNACMRYVVPPPVLHIPPKPPAKHHGKRQAYQTAHLDGSPAANGWRDAPGSHMLGKSLSRLGDHELTACAGASIDRPYRAQGKIPETPRFL